MSNYDKYFKDVRHLDTIDVYRVLDLFGVTDHALGHAAKKILLCGVRTGGKNEMQEIIEARDTLNRWIEMQTENAGWTDTTIRAAAFESEWPPEDRIDAIGQNGNDGNHYDDLDMSDPANWRVGDALKFMDVDCELYTQYDVYQILDIEGSTMKILCDKDASGLIFSTWPMGDLDCFQWHSRPSSEQ